MSTSVDLMVILNLGLRFLISESTDDMSQCDFIFRSKLIKSVFKMKDEQASMQGVTQERAYELVTNDKIDDLLEEVLKG